MALVASLDWGMIYMPVFLFMLVSLSLCVGLFFCPCWSLFRSLGLTLFDIISRLVSFFSQRKGEGMRKRKREESLLVQSPVPLQEWPIFAIACRWRSIWFTLYALSL